MTSFYYILGGIALLGGAAFAWALPRLKTYTPAPQQTHKAERPVTSAHLRVLASYAHSGDSKAQIELALRYLHGEGVRQNVNTAGYWFKQAAKNGNPKGMLYEAYLYEQAGDIRNAEIHLNRAAERGNAEAMERLGHIYMAGDERLRNESVAADFYKKSAEAGRRSAQRHYAECLLLGKGVAQDIESGTMAMELAASQGDTAAKGILDLGIQNFIRSGGHHFAMAEPDFGSNTDPAHAGSEGDAAQNPFFTTPHASEQKHERAATKQAEPETIDFLEMPASAPDHKPKLVPADTKMSLKDATEQLERLIGLDEAKSALLSLTNRMRLQQLRTQHNLPEAPITAHMVFSGNPGTGKTTVARLVGNIFREIGMLQKGHVVEVSRADLIGEYVGQTAPQVQKKVAEALDGVLFIDEAYSLMDSEHDRAGGFGAEAIATLLKLMEDNRHRLVVIMAGYTDRMQDLVASNPGLSSRFARTIDFEDFNAYELFQIFEGFVEDYGYTLDTGAAEELSVLIQKALVRKDDYFGNARFMRQIFDQAINGLANRVAAMTNPQKADLVRLTRTDIVEGYRTITS